MLRALPPCETCGKPVKKPERRYCSHACYDIAIRATRNIVRPPTRYCENCGAPLLRKQRTYCTRACADIRIVQHARVDDPTRLQIIVRAAKIRAHWSEDVRKKRAGKLYQTLFTVPAFTHHRDGEYVYDPNQSVPCEHIAAPSTIDSGD